MLADFEKKIVVTSNWTCGYIKYNGEDWDAFIGHLIVNFFDAFFMVCDAFLKKHKSVDNIFGSIDFCLFLKNMLFLARGKGFLLIFKTLNEPYLKRIKEGF